MVSNAQNIGSMIAQSANADPNAIAVEYEGKRYSRAQIVASSAQLAQFFADQGVERNSAVAVLAINPVRGIEAMIALWSLGAAVLFLDPRQTIHDINETRARAALDFVFSDSHSFVRRGGYVAIPPNSGQIDAGAHLEFPTRQGNRDALILSSSGTTGVPKYRRVTHSSFLQDLQASQQLLPILAPTPVVIAGSLAFGAVLARWVRQLTSGTFILALPLFFRTFDLHEALSRADVQSAGLPPVLIRDLLKFHETGRTQIDRPAYPNISRLSSTGGPILPQDLMRAYRALTPGIHNLYSMSGAGVVSNLCGDALMRKPTSVGKPVEGVSVRIVDRYGNDQPQGETGRIIVTPAWKTGAMPIDSGDLGYFDEEGYLYVTGRLQQIASRSSINVDLSDLESSVKALKGVRDCVAFSVRADQAPDDCIYLAIEAEAALEHMRSLIRKQVSSYKLPDKILVTQNLPRNASNKIALAKLRDVLKREDHRFVDF